MKHTILSLLILLLCVACNTADDDLRVPYTADDVNTVFSAERLRTITTIEKYADEQSVVLCILTDNHLSSNPYNQLANEATLQNIAYITQHVQTDGVVHLGDMLDTSLYLNDGKNDDELYDILNTYICSVNALHPRTFIINGNHDGDHVAQFNQDRWLSIVAPLNDDYVHRSPGTPFFYYDIPDKGVRCVFMAVPDNPHAGYMENGFSPRLLQWLQDEALVVEEGTDIILFAHIPVFQASYYPKTEGRLPNRDSFEGMCNAFNTHTAYADDLVQVDFSHNTDSHIVAYICGHAHCDLVAEPGFIYYGTRDDGNGTAEIPHIYRNTLSFPVVLISNNYFVGNIQSQLCPNGGERPARIGGKYTQDLWDTMIYNKSSHKFHFIRFGAGEDRHIR